MAGGGGKAYLVVSKGKELLPQTVALLLLPLLGQELDNLIAPADELVAVPPNRVRRIRELDGIGIPTGQPQGLTKLRLLIAPSSHFTAHRSEWGLGPGLGGKERGGGEGGGSALRVPTILGRLDLLAGRLLCERGERRLCFALGHCRRISRVNQWMKGVQARPPGRVRGSHRSDPSPSYSCAGTGGTSRFLHDSTEPGVVGYHCM